MKSSSVCAVLLCLSLLAGCAGERAFRNARGLYEAEQYEAALEQYRLALRDAPNNSEYRIAYLNARDHVLQKWLGAADVALAEGRGNDAGALYRRALQLDADNSRARVGLQKIERDARHAQLLAEAQGAISRGDMESALTRIRTVLGENPSQTLAQELKASIESKRTQQKEAGSKLAQAFRKPISIEFRDVPLRQIFEVLSRDSGLNFVLDKEVRGDQKATLFLRDTTIANALSLALMTNQLEQRVLDGSSVLIYPATAQKQREYQMLSVRSFVLANGDAKTVANTLRNILKLRDIAVDEKQNLIIVRDTGEAIRMAEKLILLHDQPPPEVMLEVEVLEVQRSSLLSLGIQYPTQLSLSPLTVSTTGPSGLVTNSTLTLEQLLNLNKSTIAATIDPLVIRANHNVMDVRVLANPRIRVLSREKAKVVVGKREPAVTTTSTSTGFVSNSVQYIDVGLKLGVEPTVFPDGEVTIKLDLEVSSILNSIQLKDGSVAYEIGTRNADTILRLHDGENQVLAGLINDIQNNGSSRVPGLGDVPVVGNLFSYNNQTGEQSEILLSITPRIVRPLDRPGLSQSEFEVGTESNSRGDSGGGGMTPLPASGSGGSNSIGAPSQPRPLQVPSVPPPGDSPPPRSSLEEGDSAIPLLAMASAAHPRQSTYAFEVADAPQLFSRH
ncbi:secretin N-terminal domain-containing protein [Niveibacterium sp. SC-1]|uniref:secretin N-terminal domain-containing protein n=1 Tax=Niveibacterium sp. SC-1 TaxID=3135646 RepID=UPI00311FFDF5